MSPRLSRSSAQPLSLKGRAMALLAQREQSEVELRRKLLVHARRLAEAKAGGVVDGAEDECEGPAAQVDAVIVWLRQHDYLNEQRFVESRVHARSARFGATRIRRELAQHGLQLSAETATELRSSEAERAADVWQRKFGRRPVDAASQAKQLRFLVARGFAPEVVRPLVRIESAPRSPGHDGTWVDDSQLSDD